MLHTVGHVLLHMGPGFGMVALIVWAMWRTGQLTNPGRARELPLEASGIAPGEAEKEPVAGAIRRRIPLVALTMALLMGIGVGIPIAAVVIGSHIQVSATQQSGEEHH